MAALKKFNGTTWVDSKVRKLTTSTDTITTLPADLYADGNNATVGLVGNMQQTGTPTPTTPIQPSETGDRTGNLWSENYSGISADLTYVPIYVGDGEFTLSTTTPFSGGAANIFLLAGNVASGASTSVNGVWNGTSRTVTAIDGYVTICYRNATSNPEHFDTMLNTGATPIPYEPYGYKLTISSASTTTPVYLGEVESTRWIRELVLTGEEGWEYFPISSSGYFRYLLSQSRIAVADIGLCTHYKRANISSATIGTDIFTINTPSSGGNGVCVSPSASMTIADFKAYLAAQYAAGTPVTVWYVLATPETAVVNEPIRKIGDYADTVSGITIPTITGADSFDVLTTLKPSEVNLTYTGWHDASVKEWDGSDWQ